MSERAASMEEMADELDRLLGHSVRGRYWVTTDRTVVEAMDGMDALEVRAHSHEQAAVAFMEGHYADLDYPEEQTLWVWESGEAKARCFVVQAVPTVDFIAEEQKA